MFKDDELYKCNDNYEQKIIKEIKKVITIIQIVHLIYFLIFIYFKIPILALTNIISLVLYILLINNLRIQKFKIILNLVLIEVIAHIILCGLVIGEGTSLSLFCLIMLMGIRTASHFYNRVADEEINISKYIIITSISYIIFALYGGNNTFEYVHRHNNLIELLDRLNCIITILALNYYMFVTFKEITMYEKELNEKNKQLHNMSYTDPLTLLYKRRAIYKYIDEYSKDNNKYSIILCDIDNFKMINDKYGHICGDLVIKEISNTIKNELQNQGYAAWWGGDEILILFDGNIEEAFQISEKIRRKISGDIKKYNDNYITVTVTIGIATGFGEKFILKEAIEEADR